VGQNPEHMIDFELTDEQRLIPRDRPRLHRPRGLPARPDNDRRERFDTELVQKIADMGFLGAIVPEQYGGRDVDYRTYALIVGKPSV
jgi:alkylation response protein AidB-like acyl-CoA dehydrogenase